MFYLIDQTLYFQFYFLNLTSNQIRATSELLGAINIMKNSCIYVFLHIVYVKKRDESINNYKKFIQLVKHAISI